MKPSIATYIALGSNLNNPQQQLTDAIAALKQLPNSEFIRASRFYQTAPVGFLDQPDFLNAVVCIKTTLPAPALLKELQKIETAQGRVRGSEKNGPRTLDLDLLLYGDEVISTPELIVPHPRMYEREFVLMPLWEIAPDLKLPTGK
jgi:2-amino-4-hydroxy-6-hydroxymethyldihydropteridine diphosphokinase